MIIAGTHADKHYIETQQHIGAPRHALERYVCSQERRVDFQKYLQTRVYND